MKIDSHTTWISSRSGQDQNLLFLAIGCKVYDNREAWASSRTVPFIPDVRKTPEILVADPAKDLKSFTIRQSKVAGTKRGQGKGTFVGSVLDLVDSFHEDVVQHLKPWTPAAPTVQARTDSEDDQTDDGISGELPLKSIQRAPETHDYDLHVSTESTGSAQNLDAHPVLEADERSESLAE
jgi:hypothetical protein